MIIDEIKKTASNIEEEDLNWLIPKLVDHYSSKIKSLSYYAYGPGNNEGGSIAFQAFEQYAVEELHKGLFTYLFKSQHWRTGRDVNTYLLTCLNRLADRIKSDADSKKKVSIPICPACKNLGHKEFLHHENKLLRCMNCDEEISRIEASQDITLKDELTLRKIFVLHTRRGYRCPDCERFVPDSYIQQYGVTCPYNDCCFFGSAEDLELMAHPMGLGAQNNVSLNTPINSEDSNNRELQDFFESQDVSPDVRIEINQNYEHELITLVSVIDSQIDRVLRNEGRTRGCQKILMYEAYRNMVKRNPEDMVSYLVHRKHVSGQPVQSRIFQEFVALVENEFPFEITVGSQNVEVYSLLDPNLGLFLGVSEFNAVVQDQIIPNNTAETYTGGRKMKYFGPCFIGFLADVVHAETGESLKDQVDYYTFGQICMKDTVSSGTPVKVTHFRIASHYEMGGLVYLQRIRRKIVDSVYFKLYGKKRQPRQ